MRIFICQSLCHLSVNSRPDKVISPEALNSGSHPTKSNNELTKCEGLDHLVRAMPS